MNIEELKTLICSNLDVIEFLDILGLELVDIVNFPDVEELIEKEYTRLERAVR